jgi:hypothetical protein
LIIIEKNEVAGLVSNVGRPKDNNFAVSTFQKWLPIGDVHVSKSLKILIFNVDGHRYFVYADAMLDVCTGYQDGAVVYGVPNP